MLLNRRGAYKHYVDVSEHWASSIGRPFISPVTCSILKALGLSQTELHSFPTYINKSPVGGKDPLPTLGIYQQRRKGRPANGCWGTTTDFSNGFIMENVWYTVHVCIAVHCEFKKKCLEVLQLELVGLEYTVQVLRGHRISKSCFCGLLRA